MKSRPELLREAADHPERLVAYVSALQKQLTAAQGGLQEKEQYLAAARRELQQQGQDLTQVKEELRQKAEQLAQAQAIIAQLKRELFGAKADKLNAEQEQQLRQLVEDVPEQNQRPPPLSRELLEEAVAQAGAAAPTRQGTSPSSPAPGRVGETAGDPGTGRPALPHEWRAPNPDRPGSDHRV